MPKNDKEQCFDNIEESESPEQAQQTGEIDTIDEIEDDDDLAYSDQAEDTDNSEQSGQDNESEITVPAVIEAVLFATDEPIGPGKIAEIVGTGGVKEVRKHIEELNEKYCKMGAAFRIEEIANGYQMLTLSKYNTWLRKLLKVRAETKLSPAALETLAIIAYKQPILRVDIEAIRGVSPGEMIRQLSEKGLVKIVGRAEVVGRPLLYGTTKKFLEIFGLASLSDLPTVEELKTPLL